MIGMEKVMVRNAARLGWDPSPRPWMAIWRLVAVILVISAAATWSIADFNIQVLPMYEYRKDLVNTCPQVDPVSPQEQSMLFNDLDDIFKSSDFRNESINRLSNIVKIPSISYDDMGEVGEDKRFEIFYDIEEYLEGTFPLVHEKLNKENINTHGLLYTWEGSNKKLQPTILMAHQDVVPVEPSTINSWTHPPFSGYFDGTDIWGRGASDCKNQLIAVLEAVEGLLKLGYMPRRTLLLSFGFDEEISGGRGAGALAPFIQQRYGKDSIAAIIDEGAGWEFRWNTMFAAPAVGEKGYTDVQISVRMPGGHSSVPAPHTSIGVLSELITLIEKDTYLPYLADENPYLGALQCGARFSPSFPKKLRRLLSRRSRHTASISPNELKQCAHRQIRDRLAEEAALHDLSTRYLVQTSQAVDLISGGAKVNALPELASAVVNHRVNVGEHPSVPHERIARLAGRVAKAYNLTLYAYPSDPSSVEGRSITLTVSETTLEPAPPTPLDVYNPGTSSLSPWGVLSGTTRALYGTDVLMAPGMTTGNTDTRFYWNLTRHIFRYGPGADPDSKQVGFGNIHTVNEKQNVVAHINGVRWFAKWIGNLDEAEFD